MKIREILDGTETLWLHTYYFKLQKMKFQIAFNQNLGNFLDIFLSNIYNAAKLDLQKFDSFLEVKYGFNLEEQSTSEFLCEKFGEQTSKFIETLL